ncbi:MAG: sodium:proton antiporter [Lachnospiraceae bacterium]|nr:sodium:proton antiporter [Lachnospiraceae bacterium]
MLEILVILAFVAVLMACVVLDISIVYALVVGYFIFFFYGVKRGFGAKNTFMMSVAGVKTVKNLLITFLLIGVVTALWRAAGTIPVIICYASKLIHPSAFVVIAFLLNALISLLTGTAFGTAATMGVICMTMALAMGIEPLYVGGAILSGVFWGDRCSPVSTSALLVSELTKTDLYENIKRMVKTGILPTIVTCVIYLVLGMVSGGSGEIMDMEALFAKGFELHWALVLPAVMILVLAAFRVKVKQTLTVSAVLAAILAVMIQKIGLFDLVKIMLLGYETEVPELAAMMNGGGVSSMVRTAVIVGLSSSFSGIFEGTGLLNSMKKYVAKISDKATPFGATLLVSILTSMVACNQTLAAILSHQLCRDVEPDEKEMAIYLENTVIVMAPLVPWSIAGAVPLATVGAPMGSILLACYLYILPIWQLVLHLIKREKHK